MRAKRVALVTTSWDDGHPLDLRVASALEKHGMRGTFYVPLEYDAVPRLAAGGIRQLQSRGMEIGAHTVLHRRLTELAEDEAAWELDRGRDRLEQLLRSEVRSFCFPEGKFSRRLSPLLQRAGYELGRTTVGFRTDLNFHPYSMPVTVQFWPHSRQVLLRHSLLEQNFSGLTNWMRLWHGESDLLELTGRVMDHIEEFGGVFHIWGHSWELEKAGLWGLLDKTLARCAHRSGVSYVTNLGVLESARSAGVEAHG